MSSRVLLTLCFTITLTGCNTASQPDPPIGEAFAGPATLNLHKEIDPKSPTSAVVHHGERLEIVAQRRRWYKVRAPKGAQGWTDDRQLLDTALFRKGQLNFHRKAWPPPSRC